MDRSQVSAYIIQIASEILELPVESIDLMQTLQALGADKLDRFEIIIRCEDHFQIEITDAQADAVATLNDLIDCVMQCQSEQLVRTQ